MAKYFDQVNLELTSSMTQAEEEYQKFIDKYTNLQVELNKIKAERESLVFQLNAFHGKHIISVMGESDAHKLRVLANKMQLIIIDELESYEHKYNALLTLLEAKTLENLDDLNKIRLEHETIINKLKADHDQAISSLKKNLD